MSSNRAQRFNPSSRDDGNEWLVRRLILTAVAAMMTASAAVAVEPDEILPDPALEARARHISGELRCLVCQNQSIDDSNAPLARDLRLLVRERLKAGDSNEAVLQFVEDRYGEFVLLRPPLTLRTILLWLTPGLVLLAAIFMAWRGLARRRAVPAATVPLSLDEEDKLRAILAENEGEPPTRD
jgi:cytochrome c-type biogenesis protein CcmH